MAYSAGRRPPALVLADAGDALFQGSIDDLQVADGALRWVASVPQHPSQTLLDSMPLPAGPMSSRLLPDQHPHDISDAVHQPSSGLANTHTD